ncbi:hypothetical protein GALMADRAFT_140964 [Galerina marginata CBS 339.88]|uniref:Uncharacterized protein n=1 Tax=Galerina marginata (strain CBS 339.88) TaxID=685588 RepID=A0A067T6G3_GALM3|nr:hypothetical protein GALMADRAFT_140964 [Galerina marginata CBS 339.88]
MREWAAGCPRTSRHLANNQQPSSRRAVTTAAPFYHPLLPSSFPPPPLFSSPCRRRPSLVAIVTPLASSFIDSGDGLPYLHADVDLSLYGGINGGGSPGFKRSTPAVRLPGQL